MRYRRVMWAHRVGLQEAALAQVQVVHALVGAAHAQQRRVQAREQPRCGAVRSQRLVTLILQELDVQQRQRQAVSVLAAQTVHCSAQRCSCVVG
jgi:hypothetical protein